MLSWDITNLWGVDTLAVKRAFKRLFVGSDPHCGHRAGLTHPNYWEPKKTAWGKTERECWEFYKKELDLLKPFDAALWAADLIAGDGRKNKGIEMITTDRVQQAVMAADAMDCVEAPIIRCCYGTRYHTGQSENWEDIVIKELLLKKREATIENHYFGNLYGKEINVRHKIANTSLEQSEYTALVKEFLVNRRWWLRGVQPRADILIRGHVHRYDHLDHDDRHGFICPSLQGLGDDYGERECSGIVDFGFIYIDVYPGGRIEWGKRIMRGKVGGAVSKPLFL